MARQILQQRQPGYQDLQTHKQGLQSFALTYQHGGQGRVIRLKAGKPTSYRQDQAAWKQLASSGLPIPEIFEIGHFPGGSYCLSSHCPGTGLSADQWAPVLPSLLSHLSRLHASPIALAEGHAQAQHWHRFLSQVGGLPATWLQQTRTNGSLSEAVYQEIVHSLTTHLAQLPPTPQLYFLHNDLNADNLLFVGNSLSGFLDWGDARLGDFLYDATGFVFKAGAGVPQLFWDSFYPHYAEKGFDLRDFQPRFQTCLAHNALKMLPFHLLRGHHDKYERALAAFRISRDWRPPT